MKVIGNVAIGLGILLLILLGLAQAGGAHLEPTVYSCVGLVLISGRVLRASAIKAERAKESSVRPISEQRG